MLLEFVDREMELRILEEKYKSRAAEFIPIYGRRRVGKTELIKQFVKNKQHFYFLAKKKRLDDEMERFRLKFSKDFNVFIPEVKSWEDLFENVFKNLRGRLIVVIDEFPFWVEKDNSVLSDFQHLWDEFLKNKNIFLILCGSSVSVMESDVVGYKSPLYGRRTAQIEVNKLGFEDFLKFFPNWNMEEAIKAYGALDGIPFYIKEFESNKGVLENIKNTFWASGSVLNKEAEFLLSQELREVDVYLSIMRSIFEGASKLNEIATKSRVEITNINKYLKVLIDLKFVSTESPIIINRPKRKNFLYKISDNFFNFWLSYVYPSKDDIEIGEIGGLINVFSKDYNRYLGFVFEGICKQIIPKLSPSKYTKIGRWWYQDKEIDIVCLEENKKEATFIECKWADLTQNGARKILEELKEKAKFVNWERKKEYFGLVGKKILGKEALRKEGFFVWDLRDLEDILWRQ